MPLIYFLKMKQSCNTGGNRAHPHVQEKSSGNSEADEVRVGGSSFYKGTLGDCIQLLLPGKSGLGFQPGPGAPSMPGLRERVLGQQLRGNGTRVKLVPSKSGSHLDSGSQCNEETGVASWEGAKKEINLKPGFEGVGW